MTTDTKKKRIERKELDKFKIKTSNDLDYLLGRMSEVGLLKECFSEKDKEMKYSLSEEGKEEARKLLNCDDGKLYLTQLIFNHTDIKKTELERLLETAVILKKLEGFNVLRLLAKNKDKIKGGLIINNEKDWERLCKEFD